MSVIKSDLLINVIDNLIKNPTGRVQASRRTMVAKVTSLATSADIAILARLPVSARIFDIELYADAISTDVLANLTLYRRELIVGSNPIAHTYTAVAANIYTDVPEMIVFDPATFPPNNAISSTGTGKALALAGQTVREDATVSNIPPPENELFLGVTLATFGTTTALTAIIEYSVD